MKNRKHSNTLVRLAGRSYRIFVKLTSWIGRFPLERFIIAIELFIQWVERQEAHNHAQTTTRVGGNAENRLFQTFVDLQRQQLAAQETTNAHLSLIAASTRPLTTSPLFIQRKIYRQEAIEMLGISDRTHDRRKAEGKLKPRGQSHDFFYPEDLEEALAESRRRGRA